MFSNHFFFFHFVICLTDRLIRPPNGVLLGIFVLFFLR